jgi:hypothetical protein
LCRLIKRIQDIVLIRKKSLKFNGLFDELVLILLDTIQKPIEANRGSKGKSFETKASFAGACRCYITFFFILRSGANGVDGKRKVCRHGNGCTQR